MACIDVLNLKVHSFLEGDDYDHEQGVWRRLSASKEESEAVGLEEQDVLMVHPYIFRVEY